jgi:hypothetical protein
MKHSDRRAWRLELARDLRALIDAGEKPDAAIATMGTTRTLAFKALRELREAEIAASHIAPLASPIDPLLL